MPDSFDQFPDASTALRDAHKRDAWNVFPDARDAFSSQKAKLPPGVYPGEGPVPSVQWGPVTPGAVGGGMLGAGQRIGSLLARVPGAQSLGMPTSGEFHQARANLEADRQAAGESWHGSLVRGAVENLLPAALAAPAGVAAAITTGSAITADSAYEEGKAKGLKGFNLAGYVSAQAGAEAAGEILPAKLGYSILTLMQKVRKSGVSPERAFVTAVKSVAGDMLGEAGTQIAQNAIDYHAGVDPNALDYNRLATDVGQAVAQSALMGAAVTAPHMGLSLIEQRLADLKAVREKGYVSAEDGQKAKIEGDTRKQRLTNADAEIQQLEKEIQNASTVPSPEAEVRQPQSGQDLRGQGQNQAPAEQAGEVPQVRVEPPKPPDERQAQLAADLAAMEAAVPEQPKRDVSAEIRDALTQGPVTVSTPNVPGGFPVKKMRDNGDVMGRSRKWITPDETWVINQPKPVEATAPPPAPVVEPVPTAPIQPEAPKSRGRKPGDYFPDQAKMFLQDAISRGPSGTPAEKAAWVKGGFPDSNYHSYLQQQGQSLEQAIESLSKKPTPTQPEPVQPQEVVQPPQPVASPKSRGIAQQILDLRGQAAKLLVDTRNFHPQDAISYAEKLGGIKELKGFIADNQSEALKALEAPPAETAKPAVEKPQGEYDFENTFPTPTEAAQRELIPGQHFPVPNATDDESSEPDFFAQAASEYRGHMAAAEQSLAEAEVVRETGKRTGGKRPVKRPEFEIKQLKDSAVNSRDTADGLVSEIENIYGEDAANRFKAWATKDIPQQQTEPANPQEVVEPAVPEKRSGRKQQPLADVLEPGAVAKTVSEQAAEKGEAYVPPFTNWSKREATNKALREAGLEPVPEKLNYWRKKGEPKPKPVGKKKPTKLQQAADDAVQEANASEAPKVYGSLPVPPGFEADINDAASGVMKVAGEVRRWLAPAGVSDTSKLAAGNIREHAAELALRHEQASTALDKFSKAVGKLTRDEKYSFIDGIETGTKQASPELDRAAGVMRKLLDDARDRVRALGKGQLDNFIANYFPHIWKDPAKAQTAFGKRPLEGSKAFLKQRTIPTTREGLDLGLEPVTDNPIELTLLKLREVNRYEMAQKILAEGKDQGYVKFFKSPNQVPEGWVKINDKIAEVWQRQETSMGASEFIHRGTYYAQEDAGRVLNNYLSPGLAGNPVYDAWRYAGNLLNMAQLGLSAFHLTFTAMDAVISQNALAVKHLTEGSPVRAAKAILTSPVAPITTLFQGSKLLKEAWSGQAGEMADIVDALQAGGWRTRQDTFYRLGKEPTSAWQSFLAALKEGRPSAIPKGFAALLEQSSRPVMDYLVPRMKAGVAFRLAQYETQKIQDAGTAPTRNELRQTMARAWDSVDNRMGQMVYDNLFWSKILKDLSMASVRSVGWNLGTFRELGGGVVDFAGMLNDIRNGKRPELSHRAAYVISLPFTVGLVGAMLCYLFTGEPPDELKDLYAIPTGEIGPDGNEERVMLASYMKDVIGFGSHPLKTLSHKAHPAIGLVSDMLQNRDFYGNQIRNESDPVVEQAEQAAKHLAKQFVPFSVRNAQYEKSRGQSLGKQAQSFFGVVPASRELVRTPAQNMAANFMRTAHGGHGALTPDQADVQQLRRNLVDEIRSGASVDEAVAKVEGKVTDKQIRLSLDKAKKDPAVLMFQALTDDELYDTLKVANEKEKAVLHKILFDRFARSDASPPKAKEYAGRKDDFDRAKKEFAESTAASQTRLKYLKDEGVTLDGSRELLKDYYKTKEGGIRIHGGTGLKPGYVQKLGALNSIYGK